jgi:hypothetical protein
MATSHTPSEEVWEMVAFPDGTTVLARCGYCSEPAFFLKHMIQDGDALHADNIVRLDGRHAGTVTALKCGSCNAWFATPEVKVILQVRPDIDMWADMQGGFHTLRQNGEG